MSSERLAAMALKRRESFPNKRAAFKAYSARGFSHFDKEVLQCYVQHGFRDLPGGALLPHHPLPEASWLLSTMLGAPCTSSSPLISQAVGVAAEE